MIRLKNIKELGKVKKAMLEQLPNFAKPVRKANGDWNDCFQVYDVPNGETWITLWWNDKIDSTHMEKEIIEIEKGE